jgi:hypothetical protein
MPLSDSLTALLRKGSFPLKSSNGLALWEELIRAMETNLAGLVAEVKTLLLGPVLSEWGHIEVNGTLQKVSISDAAFFLGQAHAALMSDFDIYNRKGDAPVQGLARRLRKIAKAQGLIQVSSVTLNPPSTAHGMGTGLATTGVLTFLPDPALYGADAFGSQPDQHVISRLAPMWPALKMRRHVGAAGRIGKKPHYVLAHLLNHQVNGSGADVKNVVPFAADANTKMAQQVEKHLKALVQAGMAVRYTILMGPAVGMTPGRQAALAACTTAPQRAVIEAEQHLPSSLLITLEWFNGQDWAMVCNNHPIRNDVPETVPVI